MEKSGSKSSEKVFVSVGTGASRMYLISSSAPPRVATRVSVAATGRPHRSKTDEKRVEGAVYSYIRAKRTLGKMSLNTAEISKALGIPVDLVDRAVTNLARKGVRIV